jgi:8-oxo-dGTP diphosphatase
MVYKYHRIMVEEQFKNPALAADAIIKEGDGIILIKRKFDPYKGRWAFPGGFVDYGERVEDAVRREAKEETGLDIELVKLVGVYSDPDRDPRKHVVSVSFLARKVGGDMKVTDETTDVKVFENIKESELAFDHAKVIRDAGLGHMLE